MSNSFYSALKADPEFADITSEQEAKVLRAIYSNFVGDTAESPEELAKAVAKVGLKSYRQVKITVEVSAEVSETSGGESVN